MPTSKKSNKKPNLRELKQLLALLRPHLRLFLVAMVALAGGSAINLLFPEVIRHLVEGQNIQRLQEAPLTVAGILIGLFSLQALCFYYRSYLFGIIGQRINANLRETLFQSLLRREVAFFDSSHLGDLVSCLVSDTAQVQDALTSKLSVLIRYGIQVIVGIFLMLALSTRLSLAIVLLLPVLVALSMLLAKRLRILSRQYQEELGKASSSAEESLGAIRMVKAFQREESEALRFDHSNQAALEAGIQRTGLSAFFSSFVSLLLNVCIVIVMLYGIHLVSESRMSVADLSAFLLYGIIVAVSFAFLSSGVGEFVQALGAGDRIFSFIQHTNSALPRLDGKKSPSQISLLAFDQVSFTYVSRQDAPVIEALSFELKPGTTTAIVGPSGAGKSTIVSLMLGFYQPQMGRIIVRDNSGREVPITEALGAIALVPQDAQLLSISIAENLKFGKADASASDLEQVCAQVNMLEFIRTLPRGFDTPIGERGVLLSGGQKQRLAIARALLRDPQILILDEATSSLDSENEHQVQLAVEALLKGRIGLVIAHRLATVRKVDAVLVLDKGKIVQAGTHASLSAVPGLYKAMVERQELADPDSNS